MVFDCDDIYLESNVRSESDIFEAMQDEFSLLVPVSLMMSLRATKLEQAALITQRRSQKLLLNQDQVEKSLSQESTEEPKQEECKQIPVINIKSLTQDFAYKKGILNQQAPPPPPPLTRANVFNLERTLVRCKPPSPKAAREEEEELVRSESE